MLSAAAIHSFMSFPLNLLMIFHIAHSCTEKPTTKLRIQFGIIPIVLACVYVGESSLSSLPPVMSGIRQEISIWHGRLITFDINKLKKKTASPDLPIMTSGFLKGQLMFTVF